MNNLIEQLASLFAEFPGIGERQSKRFVYFLFRAPKEKRERIANLIKEISNSVSQCKSCFRYFDGKKDLCVECSDENRDKSTIMVLEKDADYEGMRKTHVYKGMYFIFGGTMPIVEKGGANSFRTNELMSRIKRDLDKGTLKEVILAFSFSRDGDNTDMHLREVLGKEFGDKLKVTSLGRGLSTGTEIEYSDTETLENALSGRH